jgi:hypothetical protein
MERFWDAEAEAEAPARNLGFFDLGRAVPAESLRAPREGAHPMGGMF